MINERFVQQQCFLRLIPYPRDKACISINKMTDIRHTGLNDDIWSCKKCISKYCHESHIFLTTPTHTHIWIWFTGTLHRFYIVQTVCSNPLTLTLPLNLPITDFFVFQKTLFSIFFKPFHLQGHRKWSMFTL